MKNLIILACTISVILAIPIPSNEQGVDILQIPLQNNKELDVISLAEDNGLLNERNKRTIGILRELFPELSKLVEQKIQMLLPILIRTIGPILLRNGGLFGGSSGGSSSTASSIDDDDDDDDDSDSDSDKKKTSTSISGGNGRKVIISLPTFPPDEDDEDDDDDDINDVVQSSSSTTTTTTTTTESTSIYNNLNADESKETNAISKISISGNVKIAGRFDDDNNNNNDGDENIDSNSPSSESIAIAFNNISPAASMANDDDADADNDDDAAGADNDDDDDDDDKTIPFDFSNDKINTISQSENLSNNKDISKIQYDDTPFTINDDDTPSIINDTPVVNDTPIISETPTIKDTAIPEINNESPEIINDTPDINNETPTATFNEKQVVAPSEPIDDIPSRIDVTDIDKFINTNTNLNGYNYNTPSLNLLGPEYLPAVPQPSKRFATHSTSFNFN